MTLTHGRTLMLNRFDRFFNRGNRRPQDFFAREGEPNLLSDACLRDMLGPLHDLPPEEAYPLQIGFYDKLLGCDLLLPVPMGANYAKGLPILTLENPQGERGLPIFTSEHTFSLWSDELTDYVALPFATLCGYAMEANADFLVVNVAGPYGCEISFHDFSYLAEGLLPAPPPDQLGTDNRKPGEVCIQKDTPMRLGQCAGLSEGLMGRLQHVFRMHQDLISAVYLFDIAFNEGPLQPALGVRMPDGLDSQWDVELWPTMQAVLHEMLEKRTVINVFLLNQAGSMENHVKELTAPIYVSGVSP
jgi:hypothetical protein